MAYSYSLFFDFIDSYLPEAFQNIKPNDPIVQKLDEKLDTHDQFFTVSDLSQIKFLYASKQIKEHLGIEPTELNPSHFVEAAHPDDLGRFGVLRAQTFAVEREVLENDRGSALVSFTIRMKDTRGKYCNYLCQAYFFYSPIPHKAVYLLQVISRVDWFKMNKNLFHYLKTKDLSYFKFPTEELLKIGPDYSKRELEVIKLIESGMTSKQIAEKLFLSVYTVDTHRSHIIKKSGKANIIDVIHELHESGIL